MREGDKSLLMVPLVFRGRSIGPVELMDHARERRYSRQELRICTAVAGQAAAPVEDAPAGGDGWLEAVAGAEVVTVRHAGEDRVALTASLPRASRLGDAHLLRVLAAASRRSCSNLAPTRSVPAHSCSGV